MSVHNSRSPRAPGRVRLGDPLLDRYLEFVESRCRHNTVLATASDLKLFFATVAKEPLAVTTPDVLAFVAAQRHPRGDAKVVRLVDGESGLSARTIKRRLSSVSGLFSYLVLCGEITANPVPRGLSTRRRGGRGVALVRAPRTLPKILTPVEVDALLGELRHWRDRPWSRRCCWAVCAAAKCWVCGSRICGRARDECSSPTARAGISGWCRSRHGSSGRWRPMSISSARKKRRPTRC
ncbi:MAG: integrase/recombinase XerD, partial [Acidimicrobiaceae bacterium]|nr:integrase/recombinase XerD [Acidimicrobiaceae bacterium]